MKLLTGLNFQMIGTGWSAQVNNCFYKSLCWCKILQVLVSLHRYLHSINWFHVQAYWIFDAIEHSNEQEEILVLNKQANSSSDTKCVCRKMMSCIWEKTWLLLFSSLLYCDGLGITFPFIPGCRPRESFSGVGTGQFTQQRLERWGITIGNVENIVKNTSWWC